MGSPENNSSTPLWLAWIDRLGAAAWAMVDYVGALSRLIAETTMWIYRSAVRRNVRFGQPALSAQIVRVGVLSIPVVSLISFAIGVILALQMAPPLAELNQTDKIAVIVSVGVFRELGPLISAVVLTGFAGASIAAELGTMVVNEEVEALRASALHPVRFLVMPRLIATTLCLVVLTILADLIAVTGGYVISITVIGLTSEEYIRNVLDNVGVADFATGLVKAATFGLLLGAVACHHGLAVSGGAAGVGKATTRTVVDTVVLVVLTDLAFTGLFYLLGWF